MGAWGTGNFENDDASDWMFELEDSSGVALLKAVFAKVEKNAYPEAPDCCVALAAAEVVAAAKGKPSEDLPEEARNWIDRQAKLDDIKVLDKVAKKAIDRIRNKSELKELWQDSEDWPKWQQVLNRLEQRLQG
ncbi:MAG TPA: DUF4259 domain-containing protein [Candidatus Angelobacter sp.]|nr:DUF4259 domain-containing protein [Candidatus Angelobacter sp.]